MRNGVYDICGGETWNFNARKKSTKITANHKPAKKILLQK